MRNRRPHRHRRSRSRRAAAWSLLIGALAGWTTADLGTRAWADETRTLAQPSLRIQLAEPAELPDTPEPPAPTPPAKATLGDHSATTAPAAAPKPATPTPRAAPSTSSPASPAPRGQHRLSPAAVSGKVPNPRARGPAKPDPAESRPLAAIQTAPTNSQLQLSDIYPARFRNVIPGETSSNDVEKLFGEPLQRTADGLARVSVYRVGNFPRVEFHAVNHVVEWILVELPRPMPPSELGKELQLHTLAPCRTENEEGELLSVAFPERGFEFRVIHEGERPAVTHVALSPVRADLFRARVEHDDDHHYTQQLADLQVVRRMQADDPRGYTLEADIRIRLGQLSQALEMNEAAQHLAPGALEHRLQKARILALLDREDEAVEIAREVAKAERVSEQTRVTALALWGHLLADGPTHDYREAIRLHVQAIERGAPFASEPRVTDRILGRAILLEGHLAAANDVARGRWGQKEATVDKWLEGAASIVETMRQEQDDFEPSWKLALGTLKVYAGAPDLPEAWPVTKQLAVSLRTRVEQADDDLLRQCLQWEAAEGLLNAAQIALHHEQLPTAMEYARRAASWAEPISGERDATVLRDYQLGRMFYLAGALATARGEHAAAVAYFDKSAVCFARPLPQSARREKGRHGQRLVTMGIAYWQTGDREQAMRWTRLGLDLMEESVKRRELDRTALAIPYNNLALMHQELGHADDARHFSELADRTSGAASARRR